MRTLSATFALGLLLGPAAAQAAAGQVLFALGPVEIKRAGQTIVAARGSAVEVGDTVSTGPTGMTQLRMRDGSLLSLRYGSSMSIDEFRLPAAAPAPSVASGGPAASSTGGRSVLRLLRGAFRTVTGLIGKAPGDSYRVVTPVATIGIRGTDYSAAYCSGDCGKTPDGLYVGVSNGSVEVDNSGGALVLSNDQYGYVKDTSTAPSQELKPPEVLETPITPTEGEGEGESDGSGAGESGAAEGSADASFTEQSDTDTEGAVDTGSEQPEGDYELLPGSPGLFAVARSGNKDAGNNGVFTDGSTLNGYLTDAFTSIGSAQNVNRGSNDETGLRWGRWTGGIASIGGSSLDLQNSSLHWIYADTSSAPALPVTGTLSYTLVGNTNPTDNAGNVGFLGSASFDATFTSGNATVNSTLNLGFGDSGTAGSTLWQASGTGSVSFGTVFFGSYDTVSVTTTGGGTAAGTGAFAGFFTDGAAAAGLTYDLSSGGTNVSGAAAFGDPHPVLP